MSAHARLSPSDSARWLTCAGCINLTENVERKSSIYSAEGTFAHGIREDALTLGLDAVDFVGTTGSVDGYTFTFSEDDAKHLQKGIDRLREFGGRLFIEKRVSLERWLPGQFGSLDAGIVSDDLIVISDLKWGMGEPVAACRNTQQMLYALGFWETIARHISNAKKFLIIIDQPRTRGSATIEMDDLDDDEEDDEPVGPNEWYVTIDELLAFGEEARGKAILTQDPNAPRTPSEKGCRWCAAARRQGGLECPEYDEWNLSNLGVAFEDLDNEEIEMPSKLTPERAANLIRNWGSIKKFYDAVHANALVKALEDGDYGGLKAVEGRAPAEKYVDLELAEGFLLKHLKPEATFTKKLITPAQAKKVLPKGTAIPASLVERGKAKPKLVPLNDPKPALRNIEIEFDNLEDE